MIDYGLLVGLIAAFAVPATVARRWRLETFDPPVGFVDAVLGPATVSLIVGRLSALALDDPRSLTKVADLLVIRSGVEFWPGVAAGMLFVLWTARRTTVSPVMRLAALAPLCMVGYAAYEASCVLRDGCYGPSSSVGLHPQGIASTVLPIGILVAGVVAVGAIVLRGIAQGDGAATTVVVVAVGWVAVVRSLASVWLPKVGSGLTRQHRTSIVVAVAAIGWLAVRAVLASLRGSTASSS